ncbi:MAG: hypothetical protein V3S09_05300 [Candidatus Bathyarchaeia archaeon]
MSDWDDWFKRLKERKGFFFPEIDRIIEEMERAMADSFRDMESEMPRNMVRVRRLPDGSVRREYGPFVYGYSVKIGPDGKPIVREFGNMKPGLGARRGGLSASMIGGSRWWMSSKRRIISGCSQSSRAWTRRTSTFTSTSTPSR